MDYKYIIFCPYFGKLPINMNLWLLSCSCNVDFYFIVFTDDVYNGKIPYNVNIINMSFDDFRKKVQSKFPFKISLEHPYKLCDYKVAYGYIFSDMLENCEYWGFCDIDLIFGDLKKFLPKESFDKISNLGHFCMMKNTKMHREAFMHLNDSTINYKDIFSTDFNFAFDELGEYGINNICSKLGFSIYPFELYCADITCDMPGMTLSILKDNRFTFDIKKRIFTFENGCVMANIVTDADILQKEYAYIHLQKRKMENTVSEKDFMITPYGFYDNFRLTIREIKRLQKTHGFYLKFLKNKFNGIKRRFKRAKKIRDLKN
jgi:hypothetical protein